MVRLSRRGLSRSMSVLLLLSVILLGNGLYIPLKAELAQVLLEQAWQRSLQNGQVNRPWPWADTYPVARLRSLAHDVDLIVLDGEQGNSLAFAPGMSSSSVIDRHTGSVLISAHRDTHFHFLKDVQLGEVFELQDSAGQVVRYAVEDIEVVHTRHRLSLPGQERWLVLSTCYPFDSLDSDPALRYVVLARAMSEASS